jgi:hypothetical protein
MPALAEVAAERDLHTHESFADDLAGIAEASRGGLRAARTRLPVVPSVGEKIRSRTAAGA